MTEELVAEGHSESVDPSGSFCPSLMLNLTLVVVACLEMVPSEDIHKAPKSEC